MKMQTLDDLLFTGLTYIHDFEQQVSQEASKMAQASSNPELKEMFEKSVTKGQQYAERVQRAITATGKQPDSNGNPIAKAMIEEVENMIANTDASPVRDAALIVAANQQQLYRISAYGSVKSFAEALGESGAFEEMEQNLQDSKNGDEKLTKLAETQVNKEAAQARPVAA